MQDQIYSIISKIADEYGFDADKAMELVEEEVSALIKSKKSAKEPAKEPVKEVVKDEELDKKIAEARHNIELWEKKLADGSYKDRDAHVAKIEKEKKKLEKLVGSLPVAKPAKAEAKAPVKVEKVEARIKRFSPQQKTLLEKTLSEAAYNGSLEFDEIKKQLVEFVNGMDEADYKKVSQAEHFKNFVKSLTYPKNSEGCGAGCPGCFGCSKRVGVTLDELKAIETAGPLVETEVGELWDATNRRFVTGPEEVSDEDVTGETFEGKKYAVGDKTGRVYEEREGVDVFVGFKGVGKFKKL